MIEARYDLAYYIAGFDFYHWLITVKMKGAERVVFGIDNPREHKWTKSVVLRRFESIIKPGPALAGLEYRVGSGGIPDLAFTSMADFIRFVYGRDFPRLLAPLPLKYGPQFTITLRNDSRIPEKNSNRKEWEKVADRIGAFVIEDYEDDPIPLHSRMGIYAGAKMNFGVLNGPPHLLSLTPYPVVMFKANANAKAMEKSGILFGTQLPWAYENQSLVWEEDTYDNIMRWAERNGLA